VGRMYGPMAKIRNKPLTKSFFQEKWSETTRKMIQASTVYTSLPGIVIFTLVIRVYLIAIMFI
jgi:hypothetical protein